MRSFFYFIISIFLIFHATANAESRNTLNDYYQAALKHSLKIDISEENIDQARARYLQALGGITPNIYAKATYFIQDSASDTSDSNFFKTRQPSVSINADLPIFQGLKEIVALRLSHADKDLAQQKIISAKRALFMDVSQTYFSILKLKKSIARSDELLDIRNKAIKEVKSRVDLGKSLQSDLTAQQTDYELILAEKHTYQAQLAVVDQIMSYLTGLPQPHEVSNQPTNQQLSLQNLLDESLNHPDLKTLKLQKKIAKLQTKSISSDLWPHVSVGANYYPYRTGFYQSVKWDTTLSLNLPIFELNKIGQIKEYSSLARQADLTLKDQTKIIQSQVIQNFNQNKLLDQAIKSYDQAVKNAKSRLLQVASNYRVGLSTHLEVLDALQSYQDLLKDYQDVTVDQQFNQVKLQYAAGVVP